MRWVLLVGLVACKANIAAHMDAGSVATPDGEMRPDQALPLGPWGNLAPLDYPATGDDDPTATGDLLEVYFNRDGDVYRITRTSLTAAWSTPALVAELSSTEAETTPEVSYDGLTMTLASARTGTLGGNDIFMATRTSRTDPWSTPVHVPALSSTAPDGAATSPDGLTLVMDSERLGSSVLDIFITQRAATTDAWPAPQPIVTINSGGSSEGNPMLSPDQLTIYFDSNRTGDGEIHVATRTTTTGTFSLPLRVEELASSASDSDPWVSPDHRTMLFTSNRDGTQRIWQATR